MYEDLKNKTALITGSGKRTGIGYAIAEKLASCGANVIVTDLGQDSDPSAGVRTGTQQEMQEIAADLAERFRVRTLAVEMDVMSGASIARMVERVREDFDHIDVLCNNAGASFGVPNAVHTYDEDAWMKTIDVNLHSVFRVTRAVLPLMEGRTGSVINTASRAGKVPPIFNGAYAVAKAGVIMLTKVMARELAGHRVAFQFDLPGTGHDRPGEVAVRPGGPVSRDDSGRAGTGDVQNHPARTDRHEGRGGQCRGLSRLGGVFLHDRTGDQRDRRPTHGVLAGRREGPTCGVALILRHYIAFL